MLRNLFFIFSASLLITACNTNDNNKQETTTQQEEEITTITVDDFLTKTVELTGKKVQIEGTVKHVCQHGGKRLFIFGNNSDSIVKVTTGENMASFDVALEGSDITVIGTVEELRIDEEYLTKWEAELKAEGKEIAEVSEDKAEEEEHEHHAGQSGKGEKADMGEHKSDFVKIAHYREQMVTDSVDHFSFYTITAEKVTEKTIIE